MVNYTFFLDSKLVVVDSEGRLTAAADDSIKLPPQKSHGHLAPDPWLHLLSTGSLVTPPPPVPGTLATTHIHHGSRSGNSIETGHNMHCALESMNMQQTATLHRMFHIFPLHLILIMCGLA